MIWELASCSIEQGFQAELPAGEYYIGDPASMLLSGLATDIPEFNGVYQDIETDSILAIMNTATREFTISYADAKDKYATYGCGVLSGQLAIMSADIVRPNPEFDSNFLFESRVVVRYHDAEDMLMLTGDFCKLTCFPYEPEETVEQMYVSAYKSIGVNY
jgi:hypothetical protein